MNTLLTWILGQAVKETTRQVIRASFSDTLATRLWTRGEEWRAKLPEGGRLHALEAIFGKGSTYSLENPPPPPAQVLARLDKADLPDASDWTEALFQQWRWVRQTVEEPQEFFVLPEDQARVHLAELGRLLELECQKDREVFQVESLN